MIVTHLVYLYIIMAYICQLTVLMGICFIMIDNMRTYVNIYTLIHNNKHVFYILLSSI